MSERETSDQESGKDGDVSTESHSNNSKNGETKQTRTSAGQNAVTSSLPSQMPNLEDDAAWDEFPAWIRRLRRENASRRHEVEDRETKIGELTKRVDELESANLTDNQKEFARLKKLAEETLPSLETENRKLQVQVRAAELGVVDTDAIVALLDWKRVEKGDNVDTLIKDLLEAKPYLKRVVETKGEKKEESSEKDDDSKESSQDEETEGKPSVASPGKSHRGKIYTQSQLSKMSHEEINELFEKGDLKAALAEGRVRKE